MKNCSRCKRVKPFSEFAKKGDGLAAWCKECYREYRAENRERINNRQQEYREQNRERVREWDRRKGRRNLLAKYGLTEKQYDDMHEAQSGRCSICGKEPEDRLCVDHDHETGAVRGLLCRGCNAALGAFGDSIEMLEQALIYLKSYVDE